MMLLLASRPSLEVFGTCPDIYHLIIVDTDWECEWRTDHTQLLNLNLKGSTMTSVPGTYLVLRPDLRMLN